MQWKWVEPPEYSGDRPHDPRLYYRRVVVADPYDDDVRAALRSLRLRGLWHGLLKDDELPPPPGSTRRGIPPDYAGGDEHLCNARCVTGRPCRCAREWAMRPAWGHEHRP